MSVGRSAAEDSRAVRLRILDAYLEEGGRCAARGPRWPALRARSLCLSGPLLCRVRIPRRDVGSLALGTYHESACPQSDRGTGVVCAGKLCGVVSRSAGGAPGLTEGEQCGDVHIASNVPRWRRFLHCAHTRAACGRYASARTHLDTHCTREDCSLLTNDSFHRTGPWYDWMFTGTVTAHSCARSGGW